LQQAKARNSATCFQASFSENGSYLFNQANQLPAFLPEVNDVLNHSAIKPGAIHREPTFGTERRQCGGERT
jgi:hypothetical protein